ncbi:Mitogen-activated protein kinase kinase kinase A [Triticum urartu]|uniref:Mitogen-activated protein kinase kinase kinase A n=1 Tax=Triticum urartu TaxID=4572 RepID=M7YIR3_TRIUA|nr:Mitogen-activated protein kinase kinase kinase A [Triticum urartu]
MAIAVSGHWTRLRTLGCGASGAVERGDRRRRARQDRRLRVREVPRRGEADRRHAGVHGPGGGPWGGAGPGRRRVGSRLHGRRDGHRARAVGRDGQRPCRAKIADFGCARSLGEARPIGGTPAFMAPEVARGEEQGPAADVWALGCTVVEMATGRAPWGEMDNVLAAVHRIGYTDAVPEVPTWLSAEAKSFLAMCFARDARERCTAAELLEHPFVALQAGEAKARWVSPKSTLDAAFWESETDEEEEEVSESPCERIKSLSCSVLPDWDSDEGWVDVLGEECEEACDSPAATKGPADVSSRAPSKVLGSPAVPAEDAAVVGTLSSDELDAEDEPFGDDIILAADPLVDRQIQNTVRLLYTPTHNKNLATTYTTVLTLFFQKRVTSDSASERCIRSTTVLTSSG